jgi:predicted tellurium resistance membrane protein TerC
MELIGYDVLFTLITLTFLEIILGIDNLIFIALVVQKLPQKHRKSARIFGLSLAFIIRILMLMALSWVMTLTEPLFSIKEREFSVKDMLLVFGGLFLIFKSGIEIVSDVFCEGSSHGKEKEVHVPKGFFGAVVQISIIDFIFSFDSIITAIGITNNIPIIVAAVVISMLIMFVASGTISEFLGKYPSLKIVALAFIFMVGVILLADGAHIHIEKAYLYFSLFFTLAVESLNIAARKRK